MNAYKNEKKSIIVIILIFVCSVALPNHNEDDPKRASSIPYIAIEKVEFLHQRFPKYLRMGTAIMNKTKKLRKKTSRKSEYRK